MTELEEQGVNVLTPTIDIGDLKALTDVLDYVNQLMPPIRGCIQATVALRVSLTPTPPLHPLTTFRTTSSPT